jgi:hypothetical protein
VPPVPGAAEVTGLVDHADLLDAVLLQASAGDQPGEAATDERNVDVVRHRLAIEHRHVGILDVVLERSAGEAQVLVVAVGPQALLALLGVLGADGFLVDRAAGTHGDSSDLG